MSMLSLQPDGRGGLRPMESWSNSAVRRGNPYEQAFDVLDPASMSPSFLYYHPLQSQSMFPQLMRSAAQDSALVQASVLAKADSLNARNNINSLEHSMLQSSNNNSMVESSTSDEDCTAPEIRMNCISALGGGPLSPVVANMLDRTGSVGAPFMAQEDFLRMHHPAQTSPREGPLSPCGVRDGSLHGADVSATEMVGLKRSFEAGDDEYIDQMSSRKMRNGQQQCEKAQAVFQDGYGRSYAEAPLPSAVGARPVTTYSSRDDPAPVTPSARTPLLPKSNAGGESTSRVDMDSLRAILFLHASQPVPSLEEIATSRPKRRNVRISKDPQTVAARHRRERISDRMRVLQRLVPGGTKMDTVAMLDEAIHYVKFLKLQLQTLEQIGNNKNNCDAQGSLLQPQGPGEAAQLLSLTPRPFDLNCAGAFQSWQLNNKNDNTSLQAPPQWRYSNQWA